MSWSSKGTTSKILGNFKENKASSTASTTRVFLAIYAEMAGPVVNEQHDSLHSKLQTKNPPFTRSRLNVIHEVQHKHCDGDKTETTPFLIILHICHRPLASVYRSSNWVPTMALGNASQQRMDRRKDTVNPFLASPTQMRRHNQHINP